MEKYASVIPASANGVGIFCDGGEGYLETVYNKTWIKLNNAFRNLSFETAPLKKE